MSAPTLGVLLEEAAAAGGGGLRFVDRDESARFLPWAEVAARARRVAGALAAVGVRPGDRVACVLPTGEEFFDAALGAIHLGAVPVPLYPPVRLGRLDEYNERTARMLEASGARLVLTDRRVGKLLGEPVAAARPELGCATVGGLPEGDSPEVFTGDEALALVQFSSGTTVDPKPVALSHRAILAQVDALNGHWRHIEGVSGVSWLPLYHDMGLIGCVFPAIEHRVELTLIPPELFVARPAIWLRTLSRYRGVVSPAPNFAYALCADRVRDEELEGVDLSAWRVALNGAEAVAPAVLRRFCERFAAWGFRREALSPVYGLSEASLAVTFSDLGRPFTTRRFDRTLLAEGRVRGTSDGQELASVGTPLPGFEVEIHSSARERLAEGRVGRVRVRGPSLMEGYLGRPEATAEVLRDGWLETGDRGFFWQGELYLVGREKDVLILRGRNYAPEDLEHALDGVAGVRAGCTAAFSWLPEGADGEEAVVFVERRKGWRGSGPALETACRMAVLERTGLAVDRVVLLAPGTLPRTSSGKIRRGQALELWRRGRLDPPRRVGAVRLGLAMLRSWWARVRDGIRRPVQVLPAVETRPANDP